MLPLILMSKVVLLSDLNRPRGTYQCKECPAVDRNRSLTQYFTKHSNILHKCKSTTLQLKQQTPQQQLYSRLPTAWEPFLAWGRQKVKNRQKTLALFLSVVLDHLLCCVWHLPVTTGILSTLIAGVTFPPLSSSLSHHAETHTITVHRGLWNLRMLGPYEIQ